MHIAKLTGRERGRVQLALRSLACGEYAAPSILLTLLRRRCWAAALAERVQTIPTEAGVVAEMAEETVMEQCRESANASATRAGPLVAGEEHLEQAEGASAGETCGREEAEEAGVRVETPSAKAAGTRMAGAEVVAGEAGVAAVAWTPKRAASDGHRAAMLPSP